MTTIPHFAPGCFGSALAFQEDHSVCRGCKFLADCKPLHEQNLETLRVAMGITEAPRRFQMAEPTPENPTPGAMVLPKKVMEEAERLDAMGLDIVPKMQRGENPFSKEFKKYLYVAAHMLMHVKGALKHQQIAAAYVSRLNYTTKTADALARQAVQIFQHIGAIEQTQTGYRLRRAEN
jgi:hypothetical protein